ncbi:butyrophilin subfamily 2 member A1-like [Dicentrarchus labrax]|uniref:butyrophilin subfamily 2 member A1-like n=1 Tax=Dicentrarchus labrax TaxID=13489 RepID=UPI0021F56684|nr:butyrophilin subfamily 2 member A1-like [Dicentrarchus labrax]
MAAVRSYSVYILLYFFCFLAAQEQHVISVKPGDDVTLSCSAGDGSIRAVEWTRPDLEPEYVLFYRNKRSVTTNQHPSFKGRVNLADGEMKDGNVSLVINNVSISDNGTYECRVVTGGSSRHKRAIIETDPIRTIQLEVTASGSNSKNTMDGDYKDTTKRDGNKHIGLTVFVLISSAVVGMVLWKKKRHTDSNSEPAADEAVGDQLL